MARVRDPVSGRGASQRAPYHQVPSFVLRPSWRSGDAQHTVMLLPDSRHEIRGLLSSPTSRSTCQAPPHVLILRTQAVGMTSCRPRSGLLTWHLYASTADSLLTSKSFRPERKTHFRSLIQSWHSICNRKQSKPSVQ
jgi:hypothetical protein